MPAGLKKVYQYDIEGNFVAEYENISAASFFMKEKKQSLYFCLTGKYSHSRGYFWSYIFHLKLPIDILKKIKNSKKYKNEIYKTSKIYQYDLDGNLVSEYENLNHISKNKIYIRNVLSVLEGRYKISDNFIWKIEYYKKLPNDILNKHIRKNSNNIYKYDLNGNYIKKYSNHTQISKELKIKRGSVSNAINAKKSKTLKGYIFRNDYYEILPKKILKKHIDIRHKKIIQYDMNNKFIKEWSCVNDILKKYNNKNISSVLTGKRKFASGYIWKYKN
jgi:hypothetical protein